VSLKLNLGSNEVRFKDYLNVDLVPHKNVDIVCNAIKLPYEDNKVDEIIASHLIEHFHYHDGVKALKEWYRVLKVGGTMLIECPDFEAFCNIFPTIPEQDKHKYYVHVWGYPWEQGQAHQFGYTPNQLINSLNLAGFKDIQKVTAKRFTGDEKWNMAFICKK
jgi:predicted SAM-dependent methyltransferase